VVPKGYAADFKKFCDNNPKACPLLEMGQPGIKACPLTCPSGCDIANDLPEYHVFKNGKLVETCSSLDAYWNDEMVPFLLGCSFSFEEELTKEGYPVRHNQEGKNVPMFDTNQDCEAAGPF